MKRILTILLALVLIMSQMGLVASADAKSTAKEEVIYVNLTSDGDVDSIQAVNIFTGKKNILDYGDYSSVRNLTTTDEIHRTGDRITISTDSDKLYYQGNLKSKKIPWNISIRYYLDGKKISADEIAGRSGKFDMQIHITKNDGFDESFFDGYALQAGLNLDSAKFKNIEADGATIANEGSDKKLTYIVLPGTEKTLRISADASDISVGSLSINAVKLNLDMVFDASEVTSKTSLLKEKVAELNLGTDKINDKAKELKSGAKALSEGSSALEKGVEKLNKGSETLEKGAVKMENALKSADTEKLVDGSESYLTSLAEFKAYVDLVKLDVDNLKKLTDTSKEIKAGIMGLEEGLKEMEGQIKAYEKQMDESLKKNGIDGTSGLSAKNREAAAALAESDPSLAALLMANAAYIDGSSSEIAGLEAALSESGELRSGAAKLSSSYELFDETIVLLAGTIDDLASKLEEMKKTITAFAEKYGDIDNGIKELSKGMDQLKDGFDGIYDGILSVSDGTRELLGGASELADGTLEMYDGAISFADGTGKLFGGTEKFSESMKNIDSEIEDEIKDAVDEKTGKKEPVRSFVSEKNENVESVMFVMKTPAIEKKKAEQKEEPEKKRMNIFQKFIALFKK